MPKNTQLKNRIYSREFIKRIAHTADSYSFSGELAENYSLENNGAEYHGYDSTKMNTLWDWFDNHESNNLRNAVRYKEYMAKINTYLQKENPSKEETAEYEGWVNNLFNTVNSANHKQFSQWLKTGNYALMAHRDVRQLYFAQNAFEDVKLKVAAEKIKLDAERDAVQIKAVNEKIAQYEAAKREFEAKYKDYDFNKIVHSNKEALEQIEKLKTEIAARNENATRLFNEANEIKNEKKLVQIEAENLAADIKNLNTEAKQLGDKIKLYEEALKLKDKVAGAKAKVETTENILLEEQTALSKLITYRAEKQAEKENLLTDELKEYYNVKVAVDSLEHQLEEYNELVGAKKTIDQASKRTDVSDTKNVLNEKIAEFIAKYSLKVKTIPDKKLEAQLNASLEAEKGKYAQLKGQEKIIDQIAKIDNIVTELNGKINSYENACELDETTKNESVENLADAENKFNKYCSDNKLDISKLETELDEAKKQLKNVKVQSGEKETQRNEKLKNVTDLESKAEAKESQMMEEAGKAGEIEEQQKVLAEKLEVESQRNKLRENAETLNKVGEIYRLRQSVIKETEALKRAAYEKEKKLMEAISNRAKELAECKWGIEGHKNSPAYDEMIAAVEAVGNAGNYEAKTGALAALQEKAAAYLECKNNQFRPFPSTMRSMRLTYAQSLLSFAENGSETLKDVDITFVRSVEEKSKEIVKASPKPIDLGKFKLELDGKLEKENTEISADSNKQEQPKTEMLESEISEETIEV